VTLVVIWHSDTEITAVADTRISSSGQTATDAGSKLFVIPITVQSGSTEFEERAVQHSLGLAFAGSTLLANNCHGIASALTQQFRASGEPFLPSMMGIANVYAAVGQHVTVDFNSRKSNQRDWTFFELAIFGYCKSLNMLCVYVIKPNFAGGAFSMNITEQKMKPAMVITLGSGSDLFHEFRIEEAARGRGSAQSLFNRVVKSGRLKDVGGYAQYAEADEHGARLIPTIIQSPSDPDKKTLSVLGFDIWCLGTVEGLDFGRMAISAGDEAVSGRRALQAKGIDPDGPVAREVQNWASIEAALETAFHLKKVVLLTDSYSVAAPDPAEGKRYFVSACKSCQRYTPICIDPSEGNWACLSGEGQIKTQCHWCGKAVVASPSTVRSRLWSSSKPEDHVFPLPGLPGNPSG